MIFSLTKKTIEKEEFEMSSSAHEEQNTPTTTGFEITDPKLIQLLKQQPVLETPQLLNLAKLYQGYSGSVAFGQHLALLGLATQQGPQVVQTALAQYIFDEEAAEDFLAGQHVDDPEPDPWFLSIRQLEIQGGSLLGQPIKVALIVETFTVPGNAG